MDDRCVALSGRVLGDPHKASTPWIETHADLFAARTGLRPFPKTLGVALDIPWYPPAASLVVTLPDSTTVQCVPCEFERIKGFIVRTDDDDHSRTVIDVVSAVDLQRVLALEDGDRVEVEVSRSDAQNVITARRVVGGMALGIAIAALGAVFGIVAAVSSFKAAITVLAVAALVITGVLWRARFYRQAGVFPNSIPLRWPTWRR